MMQNKIEKLAYDIEVTSEGNPLVAGIINEAINNPEFAEGVRDALRNNQSIDEYTKEFLVIGREISTLNKTIEGELEIDEDSIKLRKLKKEVKSLQEIVSGKEVIYQLREKIKDRRERKGLVGEIITVKMKEQQLTLPGTNQQVKVQIDGYDFILTDKLKVKKSKDN